jgi:hypothetical protein
MKKQLFFAGFIALVFSPAAQAATISVSAFDNRTIQTGGPRTGANGTNFFNIEGANNNAFADFGVADFSLGSQGGTVTGINSLTVNLTESDAAFTMPGTLDFYLTTNTSISIDPPGSTLKYQTNPPVVPPGIDAQLGNLFQLGTGLFNTTGNTNSGGLDSYVFSPSGATAAYIEGVLNAGGTLRLVIGEDTSAPGIAATFAGFSNSSFAGPNLSIDVTVVPEPTTLALGGLGGIVLVGRLLRQKSK